MLLFLDGQSHYDTARLGAKYSAVGTSYCAWAVTAEGRFGNCIKRTSNSNQFQCGGLDIAPLVTRQGVWAATVGNGGVCGFAVKIDDLQAVNPDAISQGNLPFGFFSVMELTNFHIKAILTPSGTLAFARNDNGGQALLAESGQALISGTWMFVEFKWLIDQTNGYFQAHVNGIPLLSFTGRTRSNNVTFPNLGAWNTVRLLAVQSLPLSSSVPAFLTMRLCDVYLADLAAPAASDVADFLGDGSVIALMPNGVGDLSGWTPSSGPNWDAVNDRPLPDDDGTYISTLSPGVADLYQFEDLPGGAIVKGLQVALLARKETPGSVAIAPLIEPFGAGAPIQGQAQAIASQAYDHYLLQPYDLNPATGVRFTANEINNGQFGVVKTI